MFRRSVFALMGALVLVCGVLAGPAFAHVTIQPGEADQGGFATESFQVPNERGDASTVKVEVTFPEANPIPFVSVEPVPGWEVNVERRTLDTPISGEGEDITEAVSKITWSGGEIGPGQFQRFPVSMGPLPDDAESLEFAAVQTYSDGEVVRWIEKTPASGEEPEHPAPTLTLATAQATDATATTPPSIPSDVATTSDVDSAKTVGIIGIVLGALGLIVAVVAIARKPRTQSQS